MKAVALAGMTLHQPFAPSFDFVASTSSIMDQHSPKKECCQRTTSHILHGHVEVHVPHDIGVVEVEAEVVAGIRGVVVNVAAHVFGLHDATQKAPPEAGLLDQDLQIVTLRAGVALCVEFVEVVVVVEGRSDEFARPYG